MIPQDLRQQLFDNLTTSLASGEKPLYLQRDKTAPRWS
jgi:hypothetical protein